MHGSVMEHCFMAGITEKSSATDHQGEDTTFAFDSQILFNARQVSDESGPGTRIDGCSIGHRPHVIGAP